MRSIDIVCIPGAIVYLGLLIAWGVWIVRRSLTGGGVQPLHSLDWFLGIFKDGLRTIRRCMWIVAIPLMAQIVASTASLLSSHALRAKNRGLQEKITGSAWESYWDFTTFIKDVLHNIPKSFLRAIGELSSGAFLPFLSTLTAGLFTISVMIILIRQSAPGSESADSRIRGRRLLAAASGITGVILLGFFIYNEVMNFRLLNDAGAQSALPSWAYSLPQMLIIGVSVLAQVIILVLAHLSARGENPSIAVVASRAEEVFVAMLYFSFIMIGIETISLLPLYMQMFWKGLNVKVGLVWHFTNYLRSVFAAMVAFISVIIVVRRESVVSAFHSCTDLWAHNTKNVAAFLGMCGLLMMLPTLIEREIPWLISSWGVAGQTTQFIISLLKVGLSAFILACMVVFYQAVAESQLDLPAQ